MNGLLGSNEWQPRIQFLTTCMLVMVEAHELMEIMAPSIDRSTVQNLVRFRPVQLMLVNAFEPGIKL